MIVSTSETLTLLGGGEVDPNDLDISLTLAPKVVAADGGADHARAAGLSPLAVIGDMDSITGETRAEFSGVLHPVPDQDSTDFQKALTRVEAPLILALGFAGDRLDHFLAACSVLLRFPDRRCILVSRQDVICLAPPSLTLPMTPGDRFSIYPLVPSEGRSEGLEWPIAGLVLTPDGQVGTSNRVVADQVSLSFEAPGALLILPKVALPQLCQALLAAPLWPSAAPSR